MVEDLGPPGRALRVVVLVDAEQDGTRCFVYQRRPVVQVAPLFFPEGSGVLVRYRGVGSTGERGMHPVQPRQLVQFKHNRQVDTALWLTGGGYRAPVLPAVACV